MEQREISHTGAFQSSWISYLHPQWQRGLSLRTGSSSPFLSSHFNQFWAENIHVLCNLNDIFSPARWQLNFRLEMLSCQFVHVFINYGWFPVWKCAADHFSQQGKCFRLLLYITIIQHKICLGRRLRVHPVFRIGWGRQTSENWESSKACCVSSAVLTGCKKKKKKSAWTKWEWVFFTEDPIICLMHSNVCVKSPIWMWSSTYKV